MVEIVEFKPREVPIAPLFARVLLEREPTEKIGSIILPENSKDRHATLRCKVVAVGPECEDIIKGLVNKHVLIGRYAGDWVNPEGIPGMPEDVEKYFIVQEEDILGYLE